MMQRRSFFNIGLGFAAAGVLAGCKSVPEGGAACPAKNAGPNYGKAPFQIGLAGFTVHKLSLLDTLKLMKTVDLHYLCIKDFHLKLTATDAEIAAFHAVCKQYGVTGYGVGPIYMASDDEARKAFAYAKRVGVKVLVGVPYEMQGKKRVASAKLLKTVDRLVKEYDIKYAIHNHGPDMPELFPTAEAVWEMVKDLDPRIGFCLDIGHQFRAGKCPVAAIERFGSRLYDLHLKNVSDNSKAGHAMELPRGKMDMVAVVQALRKVNYTGCCSLEYEKDFDAPLAPVAECIGYFRGVIDATSRCRS